MAWVRIHDGAMSHPKIVGLIDWRNPFCVWVWGLSYCQQHLTDGRIVKAALPNRDAVKTGAQLVARGLWIDDGDGFRVHDYLDWNNSREVISEKRVQARERVTRYRQRTSSLGVGVDPPGSESSISEQSPEDRRDVPDRRQTARREGEYGRIFLHRWQLDALIASLGPHADGFDLDVFLMETSAKADERGVTFPSDKVRWAWVQAQLADEVKRRGLPVASVETDTAPTNKRIAGLVAGGEAFLRRQAEKRARGIA